MDRYDQPYASKVGMEEIALGMKRQKVVVGRKRMDRSQAWSDRQERIKREQQVVPSSRTHCWLLLTSSQEKKSGKTLNTFPRAMRLYRKESVCATEPGWAGSTAGPDRTVNAALSGLNNSNSIITFEDVGHMCQTQTTQMSVTTVALHISVSPDAVVCTKQTLKPEFPEQ